MTRSNPGLENMVLRADRAARAFDRLAATHWLDYEHMKGRWLLSDARLDHLRIAYERQRRPKHGFDDELGCPRAPR